MREQACLVARHIVPPHLPRQLVLVVGRQACKLISARLHVLPVQVPPSLATAWYDCLPFVSKSIPPFRVYEEPFGLLSAVK